MSCPDCFKGSARDGTPSGQITTLHGLKVYLATPPSTSTTAASPSTILYLPDAFGYVFINNQLLADTYAARTGMRVIIPDVVPGVGMSPDIFPLMDEFFKPIPWTNVLGKLSQAWSTLRMLSIGIPFMFSSDARKAYPNVLTFARAVKAELPAGGKLGVAGFCWGGMPSTALCAEAKAEGSEERLIDAQFCAHPSKVQIPGAFVDAVQKFKVPYSMAAPEEDMVMSLQKVLETEAALREKVGNGEGENGCYWEIVRYPKCKHGFAVRASPDNEVEIEAAGRACEQAIAWFKRWL